MTQRSAQPPAEEPPKVCPHCHQTKAAQLFPYKQITGWCKTCYGEYLKDYPANVSQMYAEVCQRVFGSIG